MPLTLVLRRPGSPQVRFLICGEAEQRSREVIMER